jgi:hypothetical protein
VNGNRPTIASHEAVASLPTLQRAHADAGRLAGLLQPRTGLLCFLDVPGQGLAIFEADHSSSPLSLLKIAWTS